MSHPAGTIFVLRSGGWTSWLIRVGTQSSVNHAGLCVGGNSTIEGEPGGARMGRQQDGPHVIYGADLYNLLEQAKPGVNEQIAANAKQMAAVPYNWLEIAGDAFNAVGWRQKWLDKISDQKQAYVCSVLCDKACLDAGVHLFNDGRRMGSVTPGDLLWVLTAGATSVTVDKS